MTLSLGNRRHWGLIPMLFLLVCACKPGIRSVERKQAPPITLTSLRGGQALAGGSSAVLSWDAPGATLADHPITLYYSTNSGNSWTTLVAGLPNTGSYNWTVPMLDSQTVRVRATALDQNGTFGDDASTSDLVVDSSPPSIQAGAMSINSGAASTINNYVQVRFKATDSVSSVTHYCLKYNSTAAPTANDSCWVAVAPAPTLDANVNFRLAVAGGAYQVYLWVRDGLGHSSSLSAAGSGTAALDKASITFTPPSPPQVTNVSASSLDGSVNTSIPSGSSVYIKWEATSGAGLLLANPIALYYTTDDIHYTLIANNLPNSAGAGCTITGSQTGCYQWTGGSPTSSFFRVRVGAADSNSRLTYNASSPLNVSTVLRVLAGSTDPGTDGSAESGVFLTYNTSLSHSDAQSLLVSTAGTVYVYDYYRGLIRIDPVDGIQRVVVPATGVIQDGAAPSVATAKHVWRIAFDSQGRVLMLDQDRIRRYDPVAQTVTTIIGGGLVTTTPCAPLNLHFDIPTSNSSVLLYGAADGKIYFESDGLYNNLQVGSGFNLKVYDPATDLVTSATFSGTGDSFNASQALASCPAEGLAATFDPITGAVGKFVLYLFHPPTGPCSGNSTAYAVFDGTSRTAAGPFGPPISYDDRFVIGGNGVLYDFSRVNNRVRRFDPVTQSWATILGTGQNGTCPDGTLATACPIDISDFYADGNGQLYFLERAKIRGIDQSSQVYTLMGSGLSAGDGGLAVNARIGVPNDVKVWNDGVNDRVVFADNTQFRIREFTIGGNIATLAGNGSHGIPDSISPAASQPIAYNGCGMLDELFLQVNPANGTVYTNRQDVLAKIDRSTGKWVDIAGGGGTNYTAADGLAGNQIGMGCYDPMVIGFDGGSMLLIHKAQYNSGYVDSFYKLYSSTTGTQSHLAGVLGNPGSTFSADGTAATLTHVPFGMASATWDAFASTWVFFDPQNGPNQIRKQAAGGAIGTVATLPLNARAFAYRHDATNNLIYYCDVSSGKLAKYDVGTSTNTLLPWPIPGMSCYGKSVVYSSSRNSLIFPFIENGIGGVAEYLNP